jgi:hypothetical protein
MPAEAETRVHRSTHAHRAPLTTAYWGMQSAALTWHRQHNRILSGPVPDKNSQVPSDTQCAALCSPPAQQAALTVTSRCGMRHHVRYHTGAARQGASGFVDQPGQSREPELSPRTSTECSILLPAALVTAHARAMQPQAARRTPVAHHRATKTCRPAGRPQPHRPNT